VGSIQNPLVREFCHQNHLEVTAQNPGPEGYVLHADENAVVVAGSDERGAFYGLQSLKQLLAHGERSLQVPGVQVRDWPDKRFRGVKLYVPGRANIPYFRRFIREVMALYKFNTLMMEMNACMRLDRHPEVNAGWLEYVRDTNYSRLNYSPGPLRRTKSRTWFAGWKRITLRSSRKFPRLRTASTCWRSIRTSPTCPVISGLTPIAPPSPVVTSSFSR
jgi:hypothetical protein